MPPTLTFADQATGIVLDTQGRWDLDGTRLPRVSTDIGTALQEVSDYLGKHPDAEAWIGYGELSFRIVLPPSPAIRKWMTAFRATGMLAPVRLGLNLGDVISILGLPQGVGHLARKHPCSVVFRYDKALDFHFDRCGGLFLVHDDGSDVPRTMLV